MPAYDLTGDFFHGTRQKFDVMHSSTGGEFGPGIYLTDFEPTAWFYATQVAQGPDQPHVYRVRTTVRHPFIVDKVDWIRMTQRRSPSTVQKRLHSQGYDSIVGVAINGYEWQLVVFDPAAIKIIGCVCR